MRLPFKIIYEDDDVLVVNKPAGLITSSTPREKRPTLLKEVAKYLDDTAPSSTIGLIHRLDKDVSGLLVFTKNRKAYFYLKRQLKERKMGRIYLAIVHGKPTPREGRINSRLIELPDGMVRSSKKPGVGEPAVTEYKTIRELGKKSLVRVTLHTGRKHQIRAHLKERGVPIVNDPMYAEQKPEGQMMLVAFQLMVEHPRTKEKMQFESQIPLAMSEMITAFDKGSTAPR